MAEKIVTAPDGRKFKVTAPEGASDAEISSFVQAHMPKMTISEAAKEFATTGQKRILHNLGQLAAGATLGIATPLVGKAQTREDAENRIAGGEMLTTALLGLGGRQMQPPLAVRGAGGRFVANDPRTFSNAAEIAATAKTPPATAPIPPLNTATGKLASGGAGLYGLYHLLKAHYPWLP